MPGSAGWNRPIGFSEGLAILHTYAFASRYCHVFIMDRGEMEGEKGLRGRDSLTPGGLLHPSCLIRGPV